MSIDYNRLRELVDAATPGPWRTVPNYDDGQPRPDDSCLIKVGDEYLGIMHGADAELTVLAPELARELLTIRQHTAAFAGMWARGAVLPADLKLLEMSGAPIPAWAWEKAHAGEVTMRDLIIYWAGKDREDSE